MLTPIERKVDVDSERFTMLSPPIEPVPLSTESTSGDDEAAGHQSSRAPIKPIKQQDQICKTPGCVIAGAVYTFLNVAFINDLHNNLIKKISLLCSR